VAGSSVVATSREGEGEEVDEVEEEEEEGRELKLAERIESDRIVGCASTELSLAPSEELWQSPSRTLVLLDFPNFPSCSAFSLLLLSNTSERMAGHAHPAGGFHPHLPGTSFLFSLPLVLLPSLVPPHQSR
jgi:hypothetical protein